MIKNLIFLGAPGVGKGTIAKEVSRTWGLKHISTGDIFRNEISSKSELGLKVEEILASGKLVSDDITNEIIKKTLTDYDIVKNGFILDGYPRTINQAEFLENLGVKIDAVVLFDASLDVVKSRLLQRAQKENRKDDTEEVIEKRIEIYFEKTSPLIKWYETKNMLKRVDVAGTVEENMNTFVKEIG